MITGFTGNERIELHCSSAGWKKTEECQILSGRKDAGKMGRGYISFEDIEKIVGRENMICFCELMKEKFEQTDEKERIKIEFLKMPVLLQIVLNNLNEFNIMLFSP